MKDIWYAIGKFVEWTLNAFITPWGWWPVTFFILLLAFGACYWLFHQGRYNRTARERNELM